MLEIECDEDRVVLRRGFLEDPRLSFRAKGVLAYLLSRPAGGQIDARTLPSPAEAQAALRELEAAGYFRRASPSPNADALSGVVRETSAVPLLAPVPQRGESEREAKKAAADRRGVEAQAAERILARLNELRRARWTWARYTPLSTRHAKNVEHVNGRLREGYAEEDLVLVLEYLAAVDGGKDESRRFFDSVTPFNTKNFERNLAMAREWEARGRPQGPGTLALQRADGHDPRIYEKRVRGGGA